MAETNRDMDSAETHLYDDFVDESGWTSMEPEGAGHHPHVWEEFPDIASQDRWEDDFGGQPGGDAEDHLARDRKGWAQAAPGKSGSGALDRSTRMGAPGGDEPSGLARGPKPVEGDGWGAPE